MVLVNAAPQTRSLYERLGGKGTFMRVHTIFYDAIFADPWLGKFFANVPQEQLERQQTDFMGQCCGGPKAFSGRAPTAAHKHIYITQEMIDRRHRLLASAIAEAGVPEAPAREWLELDSRFTRAVVKKSLDQCKKRYNSDHILNFPRP